MAPRRSPRLHALIHTSEQGAGVTCRRSPRLHPQIDATDGGAGVTRHRIRRRRGISPAPATYLLDDDDMLREILIRLPPQPSSLPRASAVCRRWRGIVTDPRFLRQFYAHHRKPPLLGVFSQRNQGRGLLSQRNQDRRIVFNSILDPPDRIPPRRFNLGRYSRRKSHDLRYYCDSYDLLDCRHGLVLVMTTLGREVVACDPITGEQCRVAIPPEFNTRLLYGAVLCAAGDPGHVSPFKVVLMTTSTFEPLACVCVYSSKTGGWGNVISTAAPYQLGGFVGRPATLVGNALYWLSSRDEILEFNLDGQSLAVIEAPPVTNDGSHRIIKGEDGVVGFAILSWLMFQTWQRNVNGHGVATWMPWKTIEMHTILGLPSPIKRMCVRLLGYDEDNGVLFAYVDDSVYTILPISMQSRKLYQTRHITDYYPFTSFYTPGMEIAGSRCIG